MVKKHLLLWYLVMILGTLSTTPLFCFFDDSKPVVLILLWPPGSGEGVLTVKVSKAFALPHISASNLIRDAAGTDSELFEQIRESLNTTGSVPDNLVMQLFYQRIKRIDCQNGFVLDGVPRTLEHAKEMMSLLGEQFQFLAVFIKVPDDVLVAKAKGRFVCENCGRVYHQEESPPERANICDHCDESLAQRKGDAPDYVQKRLEEYYQEWQPIFSFYRQRGMFMEVNGDCPQDKTFQQIKTIVHES